MDKKKYLVEIEENGYDKRTTRVKMTEEQHIFLDNFLTAIEMQECEINITEVDKLEYVEL